MRLKNVSECSPNVQARILLAMKEQMHHDRQLMLVPAYALSGKL
jgi:hypothetical protein